MDAINRSATRRKTLHCGVNQSINLERIKAGIASIQFKIGFHHQDCFHPIFVDFNRRPDVFDVGVVNGHGAHSLLQLSAEHIKPTTPARPAIESGPDQNIARQLSAALLSGAVLSLRGGRLGARCC